MRERGGVLPNLDDEERCESLRWKGMLIEAVIDPSVPHERDRLFWCQRTQSPVGPDGVLVNEYECHPGRSCYREM
jgi:hypothetical protein